MESLAGRAGRSYLQDVRSCGIRALTRVVQVVVPEHGVVYWNSLLKSPLDVSIVVLVVILGRGPLCQVPRGRPEEANKEEWKIVVEFLFLSKLSVGSDDYISRLIGSWSVTTSLRSYFS